MRFALLAAAAPLAAIAALGLSAAPAEAQFSAPPGATGHVGAPQNQFVAPPGFHRDFDRDHRGDRRRHRRGDTVVIGGFGWNEAWALYNNRTFQPDSYNDWWHDRPDRSYPRWMRSNQNCDRMWWGGGAWRC